MRVLIRFRHGARWLPRFHKSNRALRQDLINESGEPLATGHMLDGRYRTDKVSASAVMGRVLPGPRHAPG